MITYQNVSLRAESPGEGDMDIYTRKGKTKIDQGKGHSLYPSTTQGPVHSPHPPVPLSIDPFSPFPSTPSRVDHRYPKTSQTTSSPESASRTCIPRRTCRSTDSDLVRLLPVEGWNLINLTRVVFSRVRLFVSF